MSQPISAKRKGTGYLAVVIALCSRRAMGRSMQSHPTTDLALQALLMALSRRKPKSTVLVTLDQE